MSNSHIRRYGLLLSSLCTASWLLLPPGAACPIAYVDAAANPNADELARQAADQIARDFKCGADEAKVLGTPGRAAELAKRR